MAGISSQAAKGTDYAENKKGFNGNEIQSKEFSDVSGLAWYDFNARTYDQQTGRFLQVDPMSDEADQEGLSPYHFAENNPIKISDPSGKCGPCLLALPAIVEGIVAATTAIGAYVVAKSAADQLTPVIQNAVDNSKKETGSYTNKHESGKNYHGKGPESRANESANEKAKTNNDPVQNTDWKPAKNDQEAFKDEAKRIRKDGGVGNGNNYNIRNSPGEKMLKKEEAKQTNVVVDKIATATLPIVISIINIISSVLPK